MDTDCNREGEGPGGPMKKDDYERIETPTSVYVMTWGDKTKIGLSRDVHQRLRQLQLANPGEVTVAASRLFPTRLSARDAEKRLHSRYARYRLLGEWFSVRPGLAVAALLALEIKDLHHRHWHPEMPAKIGAGGPLERWKWQRENDLDTLEIFTPLHQQVLNPRSPQVYTFE